MSSKIKVMTVFGTRPEAIKMAPLVLELEKYQEQIESIVVVTAQHREMLDQVLKLFGIIPKFDLDVMNAGQTLYDITARVLCGLQNVFEKVKPDLVLVHGDTTTTFVSSLAAYYAQVSVGHVEAGLRTNNKYSPFPEEMNRKLTGALSDWHYAPTNTSKENLLLEGVLEKQILVTGNTVIDALKMAVEKECDLPVAIKNIDFSKRVILVTTHRRENLGEPMRHIYKAIVRTIKEFADLEVVFPVHKNPLVKRIAEEELSGYKNIHLIEPLDYHPFTHLLKKATLILTDSGGVQEEAPSLGKPVLVLRDTTERPEAVQAGTVSLVGTDEDKIFKEVCCLLGNKLAYEKMASACNPYGDGLAAKRIVEHILWQHNMMCKKPSEFTYIV